MDILNQWEGRPGLEPGYEQMHLPRVSFRHRRQIWARHRVVEQMMKHCALYPEWGEEVAKGLPLRLPQSTGEGIMGAHESMEHAEHVEHASSANKNIALLIA